MNPETRAARDRIAAYLEALAVRRGNTGGASDHLIAVESLPGGSPSRELISRDLVLVVADLDRYDAMDEAVRRDVRQVAAEAGFGPVPDRVEVTYATAGPRGQCEGCGCCTAEGCRNGADGPIGQRCPSNSLGESICPCTEG